MASFQTVALLLACFVSLGQAARVSSNIQLHSDGAESFNATQAIKEWQFSIKHTLCANFDFGALQGIFKAYPVEVAFMQKEGLRLANEFNCRLCDISGSQGGMSLGLLGASIKCSLAKEGGSLGEACLAGNGNAGFLGGESACVPCPEECESCSTSTSSWSWDHSPLKWFKCVHAEDMFTRPEPLKGNWKCQDIERRGKAGTGFKQWCQYRKDLLSTSTNGNLLVASSAWELKIPLARCDMLDAPGASPEVAGIMAAIAPKLARNHQWNCQFCRVEAGGPIPSSSFEFAIPGTGSKPTSWADAFCAFDQFRDKACFTERGPTDWSSEPCAPCPFECSSCEEEAKETKRFKCNLRPSIGFASQMEKLMVPGTGEDSPPATPEGFICDTPKKRKCVSVDDPMCTSYSYKTRCQYQIWN